MIHYMFYSSVVRFSCFSSGSISLGHRKIICFHLDFHLFLPLLLSLSFLGKCSCKITLAAGLTEGKEQYTATSKEVTSRCIAFKSHGGIRGSKSKPFSWVQVRICHRKSIVIMIFFLTKTDELESIPIQPNLQSLVI